MSRYRTNLELFVRAVAVGLPVKLGDYTYQLGEDEKKRTRLCVVAKKITGDKSVDVMLAGDLAFDDVMAMAERMTEEERFTIASTLALNHDRLENLIADCAPEPEPEAPRP